MSRLVALAALALVAGIGWYALVCWIAPFRDCRRCAGLGKTRRRLRGWKPCRRCHTTGKRLRVGRWIFNHLNAKRKEAHR